VLAPFIYTEIVWMIALGFWCSATSPNRWTLPASRSSSRRTLSALPRARGWAPRRALVMIDFPCLLIQILANARNPRGPQNGEETSPPARAASNGRRPNDDIGEETRLKLYHSQFGCGRPSSAPTTCSWQNLVKGTSHLSLGQEAIAAGFGCAMQKGDLSFCTYRGHAHTLARGVPVEQVLGELMQRDNGLMRGKGGSMHLTSAEHGVMGSYAIIGAHLPIACGAALRAQYRGDSDVTVCFFGDGTTNIGAFHEALNFAAIWKLPVVFVCENNHYMEYTPIGDVTAVENPAGDRASAYGLPKIVIDGNDADAVYRTAQTAYAKARAGEGPSLIECITYRHSGHSRADPAQYRPEGELERWKKTRPDQHLSRAHEAVRHRRGCDREIEPSERRGRRARPRPARPRRTADGYPVTDVYADGGWHGGTDLSRGGRARHRAGDDARSRRDLLGEDVGKAGGVFKTTVGLLRAVRAERVRDTPISEQAILGAAMGAAMTGLKPIAEIMFSDFFAVCFDYIANEFPKSRYMSNGQLKCPLVVRTANGAARASARSIAERGKLGDDDPGLKVVAPSTPRDVIGCWPRPCAIPTR
jgi:pyruvate dehydrogenase E1 component alpha subunit